MAPATVDYWVRSGRLRVVHRGVYAVGGTVLRAEGQREATILKAEGEAKAIDTVFTEIHAGNPDPQLLAYQYVQALPQIAQGASNKVWIVPAEFQRALGRIGSSGSKDEDKES